MIKETTTSGSKAYQRKDSEDRARPYRDWHRNLGAQYACSDVDSIEWRWRNGEPVPVAVIEITMADNDVNVCQKYLDAIIDRYENRDKQAALTRKVAIALGVNAYILLYRRNMMQFWLYNLSEKTGWSVMNNKQMSDFLRKL